MPGVGKIRFVMGASSRFGGGCLLLVARDLTELIPPGLCHVIPHASQPSTLAISPLQLT
jgi:hypothetical protein